MSKRAPRLLLDENIGHLVESALHKRGFDVVSVMRIMPGAPDHEVLERARVEQRIIVTLDKDFGYWVHRQAKRHAGVIYLRLKRESPAEIQRALNTFADHFSELSNKFAKITENRLVIRNGRREVR